MDTVVELVEILASAPEPEPTAELAEDTVELTQRRPAPKLPVNLLLPATSPVIRMISIATLS